MTPLKNFMDNGKFFSILKLASCRFPSSCTSYHSQQASGHGTCDSNICGRDCRLSWHAPRSLPNRAGKETATSRLHGHCTPATIWENCRAGWLLWGSSNSCGDPTLHGCCWDNLHRYHTHDTLGTCLCTSLCSAKWKQYCLHDCLPFLRWKTPRVRRNACAQRTELRWCSGIVSPSDDSSYSTVQCSRYLLEECGPICAPSRQPLQRQATALSAIAIAQLDRWNWSTARNCSCCNSWSSGKWCADPQVFAQRSIPHDELSRVHLQVATTSMHQPDRQVAIG